MADKVIGGLKWVKGEIALTLRRVRHLAEDYGATGERESLQDAPEVLLEIRGVLLALQLALPARLVEEMQRLVEAMSKGAVRSPRESAEALMLALIQLPDHLDRLEAGSGVSPLALWPIINDLRESRGAAPLTQAELLVPGSVLTEDDDERSPEAAEAVGAIFRKMRPRFHRCLVQWYRPPTASEGLTQLGHLFRQIPRYLEDGLLADLFGLADAFASAVQSGRIADGPAARAQIARLDRVLKCLVQTPVEWPDRAARLLIAELLDALVAADLRSESIADLLERYPPEQAAREEISERLAGAAVAALGELVGQKARLEDWMLEAGDDRAPLEEIRSALEALAQTLDAHPTGQLPTQLRALAAGFAALDKADRERLEHLAAELLNLEAMLQAYADRRSPQSASSGGTSPFVVDPMAAALREVRAELVAVKDAIVACQGAESVPAGFGEIPTRMGRLAGALRMLGDRPAATLADGIAALIARRYLTLGRWPRESELPDLADAIAALDLYAERLEDRLPNPGDLLQRAAASLAALEALVPLESPPDRPVPAEPTPPVGNGAASAPPEPVRTSPLVADPVLLDIFRTETGDCLAAVRAFLERSATGDRVADETLLRALHTLGGSARMAGVHSIAELAKGLERRVRPLQTRAAPLDERLCALLDRAVSAMAEHLAEIPEVGAGGASLARLVRDLERLDDTAAADSRGREPPPRADSDWSAAPRPGVAPSQWPSLRTAGSADRSELAAELERALEALSSSLLSAEAEADSVALAELDEDWARWAEPSPPAESARDRAESPSEPPAAAAEASADAAAPSLSDDSDGSLIAVFLEDARELLDGIDRRIRQWQSAPEDPTALDSLKRLLHTLKGSARLLGLAAIGDLSHALETRLTAAGAAPDTVDAHDLELAQRAVDTLSLQVDALERGESIPAAEALVRALASVRAQASEEPEPERVEPPPAPVAPPPGAREGAAVPQIRVGSELLTRLVDLSGEIGLYRSRLAQRNGLLGFGLGELERTVRRLSEQLRLLEIATETQILYRAERDGVAAADSAAFDPLELDRFSTLQQLSRALAETIDDLVSLKDLLGGYRQELADLLAGQARLTEDLQDGLLRTRMVPFAQVVARLQRVVRQTAESLGKTARLEVQGAELELDRSILDRLIAPLEHLLRNAVDHGLESPAGRLAAGKPAIGLIALALGREGNEAVIGLADDGRGLDLPAIRRQALARGLLEPGAEPTDEALMALVFAPGFTTLEQATQISGRGVGLDVAASEIAASNGTIAVDSTPGQGTRFTIRLPLTLAILEAFLVGVGETIFAVPHATLEGVARISREALADLYRSEDGAFEHHGHRYRVVSLAHALDAAQSPDLGERRWLPLLLARLGERRVALQADSLMESARILVKPLGPQLAAVPWLGGGTILPDGRVALILDALALLRSGTLQASLGQPAQTAQAAAPRVCVMVVDDSLTVRRVTSRALSRRHMEVLTAKDGVEALALLEERIPDVLLLDIEMPRMDGYELTRHIRRSERLRHVPILMITSRVGAKHRDLALSLGVDRYLGKPYLESELLAEIDALLRERRP